MELKEFVKETIIQITDGIIEGNKYIVEKGYGSGVSDNKGKEINFDIAVSTDSSNEVGAGGKISVASVFGFDAKKTEMQKDSNVSRIQFKLFVHIKTD